MASDRAFVDIKYISDLFDGEADDEAQLDNVRGARVFHGQVVEGLIEREHVVIGELARVGQFREWYPPERSVWVGTFEAAFGTGVVDEDAPHCGGRRGEEMGAACECRARPGGIVARAQELNENLVNKRGSFKHVASIKEIGLRVGQGMELVIDGRHEGSQ